MSENHLFRWFCVFFIVSFLFTTCTDGKGFGRGGGFRGGSRGGSKGAGSFGGSSGQSRMNNYGSYSGMNKPHSGGSFKGKAMSFGAGALTGVAAYSIMSSMSHSHRSGYYPPGYGGGETCTNNDDINGTRFGQFRCPLSGFPYEAKHCCGEYGKQYCCIRDNNSSRGMSSLYSVFGLCVFVGIIILGFVLFKKLYRRNNYGASKVPVEPPMDEQIPDFYQPPPPSMGYPPPPMNYPPNVNPYAVPPQNYDGTYTPYPPQQQMPYQPQHQMPYPPQQQMQYPPQQQMQYPPHQQAYNPYQVKEAGPPTYNDIIQNNQGIPTTKPA